MLRPALLLAAITASFILAPEANAGPEDDLRACYAQVIRACDGAARSGICADAGMESCDDMYHSGVTLSPEVIRMITEGDLARQYLTPDLFEVTPTPMPIPVLPMPMPEPEAPAEEIVEAPVDEEEDTLDPELAAILGLIEALAAR